MHWPGPCLLPIRYRILTPHPGEMARLTGTSTKEVQQDRLGMAQQLASESGATIVLKGDRTIVAFPDGEAWVNPTGSPHWPPAEQATS